MYSDVAVWRSTTGRRDHLGVVEGPPRPPPREFRVGCSPVVFGHKGSAGGVEQRSDR